MPYLLGSAPNVPGSLGAVAAAIGRAGGDIEAIEIVEHRADGTAVDDVLLETALGVMPDSLVSACNTLDGVKVVWVSRYGAGGNLFLDLEAVEALTPVAPRARRDRRAAADHLPGRLGHAGAPQGEPVKVLRTSAAPESATGHPDWFPAKRPLRMVLPRTGRRPPRARWSRGADRPRRRDRAVRRRGGPDPRPELARLDTWRRWPPRSPRTPDARPSRRHRVDRSPRRSRRPAAGRGGSEQRLLVRHRQGPGAAARDGRPGVVRRRGRRTTGVGGSRHGADGLRGRGRAPGRRAPGVRGRRRSAGVRHWSTSPSTEPRPTRTSRSPATTTSPSSASSSRGWRGRSCATTSTQTSSDDGGDDGVIRGPADVTWSRRGRRPGRRRLRGDRLRPRRPRGPDLQPHRPRGAHTDWPRPR